MSGCLEAEQVRQAGRASNQERGGEQLPSERAAAPPLLPPSQQPASPQQALSPTHRPHRAGQLSPC